MFLSDRSVLIFKTTHVTTIVIGAGLSGLAAAKALREASVDVIVLEAASEIGGRTRGV